MVNWETAILSLEALRNWQLEFTRTIKKSSESKKHLGDLVGQLLEASILGAPDSRAAQGIKRMQSSVSINNT